jgi:hypothetical protein
LTIPNEILGDVFIGEIDKAMKEHVGGQVFNDRYFVSINGINPPPFAEDYYDDDLKGKPMPGIPVIFASPDDRIMNFIMPCIVVRREDVNEADERKFAGTIKYRAPALGSSQIIVEKWGNKTINLQGYDGYQEQKSPEPYDIIYTVSCLSSGRRASSEAVKMCKFLMRKLPRKGMPLIVTDDIGGENVYPLLVSGPTSLKEILDIIDRQDGFSFSVTVQTYLDLHDPYTTKPVKSMNVNRHIK